MVDKIIALGLIDVRDIEEVGTGPLMEELGLDEETAQQVVDRCAEEAKIVAVEQEAEEGRRRQGQGRRSRGVLRARRRSAACDRDGGGDSRSNPLLPTAATVCRDEIAAGDETTATAIRMPGAMEATEGMAPEITTHDETRWPSRASCRRKSRRISGMQSRRDASRFPTRTTTPRAGRRPHRTAGVHARDWRTDLCS